MQLKKMTSMERVTSPLTANWLALSTPKSSQPALYIYNIYHSLLMWFSLFHREIVHKIRKISLIFTDISEFVHKFILIEPYALLT